jgi:hypothetical protein
LPQFEHLPSENTERLPLALPPVAVKIGQVSSVYSPPL